MIIDKRTFIAKHGQSQAAVELIEKSTVFAPFLVPFRILVPLIGPFEVIVTELEFKDMAEYDRFWAGWNAKVTQEFWGSWVGVTENGGGNEVWEGAHQA
jgi:hypothetical protein